MTRRTSVCLGFAVALAGTLSAFQATRPVNSPVPFREYPGTEYELGTIPLPEDAFEKTEFAFARLMYPPAQGGRGGFGGGFRGRERGPWQAGNAIWTQDYPRADRHFLQAVRRLTRIHARSVEQPINLDEAGQYDWPWLYAVQAGRMQLTDSQAKGLREYLLRGGFFMADDFWGEYDWAVFMESMHRVFPDREAVELSNSDIIFHTVYDLNDRYQVASRGSSLRGVSFKCNNCPDHWRGIFDDRGRLMVAITFQSDVGDSWEWADEPTYPQEYAALGIRIGVNYIIYAMTH
jgi:hypothetical protein